MYQLVKKTDTGLRIIHNGPWTFNKYEIIDYIQAIGRRGDTVRGNYFVNKIGTRTLLEYSVLGEFGEYVNLINVIKNAEFKI